MDKFRNYLNRLQNSEDKNSGLLEIIDDFCSNYENIRRVLREKKIPNFVNTYFTSVLIILCAEYDIRKGETIQQLLQLLYDECGEFWDFWGFTFNETKNDWKSIETFSKVELNKVSSNYFVIDYVLRHCFERGIAFPDPINRYSRVRFIDFPNEAQNIQLRNLHLPLISTTLLPEKPQLLKLLLHFGAQIPAQDLIVAKHIKNRIGNIIGCCDKERLEKKREWIEVLMIEVSCETPLWKSLVELHLQLTHQLNKSSVNQSYNYVPSLQQFCRFVIRTQMRLRSRVPFTQQDIQLLPKLLIDFLNIKF
jgi:hypothetical protein